VKEDPPDTPNLEPVPGAKKLLPKARSGLFTISRGETSECTLPSTIQLSSMLLDNHSE